jgi:hypothetical protein
MKIIGRGKIFEIMHTCIEMILGRIKRKIRAPMGSVRLGVT